MYDILKQYLNDTTTIEHRDVILQALAIFDLYGIDTYESIYEQILMTNDESENEDGDTLGYIDQVTRNLLIGILKEHLILVNEEVSLLDLTMFCQGLLDLQNYESSEDILSIEALDYDTEQMLSEMLTLVTDKNSHEILILLESVDERFYRRLREILATKEHVAQSEMKVSHTAMNVAMIKLFLEFLQTEDLITVQMLKSQIQAGLPFTTYANIVGRSFDGFSSERAANELLSMAFISSDGIDKPTEVIKQYIDTFVSDLNKITQITIKVSDKLIEFNTFKRQKAQAIELKRIQQQHDSFKDRSE